ncbi:MAG: dihydroneopterin aldolase [Gammaproteobacteria bacterium]
MMKSKISIQSLELSTTIGAYGWEQHIKQIVLLDLELYLDITNAAATDDLTQTLDYAGLVKFLQDTAAPARFQLLETLATFLQKKIVEHYPQIEAGKLCIHKPGALSTVKDVALEIVWP